MGLFNEGCLLRCTGGYQNGSCGVISRNGCQDSRGTAWLDSHSNGDMGQEHLTNGVANPEDACVGDMMAAVKILLEGLGEDMDRDGLKKTPSRVARAFLFATKGYRQVAEDLVGDAMFPEAGMEGEIGCGGGYGGMVVVRKIDLFSLCEACLLPFKVCCHVAYIPSAQRVVGLSKLSRVADMFARRLQNPQKLAEEICQGLADTVKPLGVAIALQSWHLHVPGIHNHDNFSRISPEQQVCWNPFSVCAGRGQFEDKNGDTWREFLAILLLDGIVIDKPDLAYCNGLPKNSWCPYLPGNEDALISIGLTTENHENGPVQRATVNMTETEERLSSMIHAVESILLAMGEDITRGHLRLTPKRFVRWISNFIQRADNTGDIGINVRDLKPSLEAELQVSITRVKANENGLLFQLNVPFCSQCEHHLLPFYGVAHVGYLMKEMEIVERPAILRIVQNFSRRLQVQERLTKEIAEAITRKYGIRSVMVVLEAGHICMVSRGVEKLGSSTATIAVTGCFATDISLKAAFLQEISSRTVKRTWA